jgi:hypothetical protein
LNHDDPGVSFDPPPPPPPGGRRRLLGQLLLDAGVLEEAQLQEALADKPPGERIGQTLIRLGMVDELEVAHALANQLGLDVIDLTGITPHPLAVDRVPARLAERHQLVPISLESGLLTIAMADPTDVVALDDIRVVAGVRGIRRMAAAASDVDRLRRRAYRADAQQDAIEEAAAPEDQDDDDQVEEQPVVKLVTSVLDDAVTSRASDIHVEPHAGGVRVRLRVDGVLREAMDLPRTLGRQVTSRLKIMASMDIAERRLPQDGRATARVNGQTVDLRVSTMPTLYGETVVLRVLPQGSDLVSLDELGLSPGSRDLLTDALQRPTGSGAGDGTDRLGQDHDAVRRPGRGVRCHPERAHPRGPRRGPAAGGEPDPDRPADRADLRQGPADTCCDRTRTWCSWVRSATRRPPSSPSRPPSPGTWCSPRCTPTTPRRRRPAGRPRR